MTQPLKKAVAADLPKFEHDMLKIWDEQNTFAKSVAQRQDQQAERFNFYDGPPFANGLPHYGHVVPVTLKDAVTRYKTMRGYYAPRRNGWDTHGLPVENEVEKQLGIKNKREILEYGVDKFIEKSRDSVFTYKTEWEQFFDRVGRWADKENAYATLDREYIESVWSVIKKLHQKDLLYESFRSMPYCPRCATPLSNFEVNQNYQDNTPDPSVYVKFDVIGRDNTYLLAWTTTPWTLPANAALAVDKSATYVTVELNSAGDGWAKGERLVLAEKRLELLDLKEADYDVVATQSGSDLIGWRYHPLFTLAKVDPEQKEKAWQVYHDNSVSLEDGTGVLHVAPRYGETDLEMGLREGLPLLESVDSFGMMNADMGEFAGLWFKDADAPVIEALTKDSHIFAAETFEHTYPFCWRCDSPLMYFAISTWNVRMSQLSKKMVKNNEQVNWVPGHIQEGRFGNWLADARDWGISRNRFWGNPLPIWRNEEDPDDIIVVGTLDELKELSGDVPADLHRPVIDSVVIKQKGKTYRRVEEVLDCWFESGSMPYAQDHVLVSEDGEAKRSIPAQFVAEGMDQTRGWFYTLHALATALFDKPAFENVVVNGLVLAADGKKLSKRLKNYPPMEEVFSTVGADVLRYFMMSSPVVYGENVRFSREALAETQRNVFLRLWNVHSFLTTYAEVDGWAPGAELVEPNSKNILDRWLLTQLNRTIKEATESFDAYELARGLRPVTALVDDLSNWYVRRSRRRFWKSEDDADKTAAYTTLHYVLVSISQLLAPVAPFMADRLWRDLTAGMNVPESVHLSDWPCAGHVDGGLITEMQTVREAITEGLAVRAKAGIKVRQPLASATVYAVSDIEAELQQIVQEELNVKAVTVEVVSERDPEQHTTQLDTTFTPELLAEGLARDLTRQIQVARKQAGLAVDDRIKLALSLDSDELAAAVKEWGAMIAAETLADDLTVGHGAPHGAHSSAAKVSGTEVGIHISKI